MNKLPLFKSGDLLDIIKEALLDYDGLIENSLNRYQKYSIDYDDVYKDEEHYLDVTIFESDQHFPWQPGDTCEEFNNKFRIKVECVDV